MLFASREAGLRPCSRPRAQFFPIRTDLGWQIMCLFFLSGKLLYTKYLSWFFTEAVSHRVCAFDVSVKQTRVVYKVFKRRDSVFTDFRTEQWRIYISWRFLMWQKDAKIAAMLENSEWSVHRVRMGKSGPLESKELANQIQEFRIPDCWDASEKNKNSFFTRHRPWHHHHCLSSLL